jgi:hypothetical protein
MSRDRRLHRWAVRLESRRGRDIAPKFPEAFPYLSLSPRFGRGHCLIEGGDSMTVLNGTVSVRPRSRIRCGVCLLDTVHDVKQQTRARDRVQFS